jgi:hypothetical protein
MIYEWLFITGSGPPERRRRDPGVLEVPRGRRMTERFFGGPSGILKIHGEEDAEDVS